MGKCCYCCLGLGLWMGQQMRLSFEEKELKELIEELI
jgi:hypothetical protein